MGINQKQEYVVQTENGYVVESESYLESPVTDNIDSATKFSEEEARKKALFFGGRAVRV